MGKSATDATRKVNSEYLRKLPFNIDASNCLEDIERGLIEEIPDLVVRDEDGNITWDAKTFYDFLQKSVEAPETVNPSLWRHQRLECKSGLFEVMDGIWQVRGFDVSNLTLVRSDKGYILVDSLHSPDTARAALEFAFRHLPKKPVTGIVITHSHADHFGGVEGIISHATHKGGEIPIVVPKDFVRNTIIENVFVGRAMNRRGPYQFGQKLPKSPTGTVGSGLGISLAKPQSGFVMPTHEVTATGEKLNIDGVEFIFEMTPDTEAPAEFCFYLPQFKTLCMAELLNSTLHNLLPIRGAQVRSAKQWAHYLQEALVLFGDQAEVLINTHHWPVWGKENIIHFLKIQRDLYKFINDQTVRRINHGQTMVEIAEDLELPPSLYKEWSSRNYYGHIKHNIKATYQFYLGWFDCNPANLDPLPPEEAARNYVECMGGETETLRKARENYEKGNYRWAAMLLNHIVFANSENREARDLLADVYDQLGYQSECATWRNCYLTGAEELRNGPGPENNKSHLRASAIKNMPSNYVLDYLATSIDPEKARDKAIAIALKFTDRDEEWTWILENSVLNAWPGKLQESVSENVLTRDTFDMLARRLMTVEEAIKKEMIAESGKKGQLAEIFACFEEMPNFNFGIVTP